MRCIYFSEPNQELQQELEKHNLTDLYEKFVKQGLTQDNMWTLTSDVLEQMDLGKEVKMRYLVAKEAEDAKAGTDTNLLLISLPLIITYSINLNALHLFFRAKSETATRTRET